MYNIIITVILIVSFFMCLASYMMGFKHGKQLNNGIIPSININPIKPIAQAIEKVAENKKANKVDEELTDIMGYSKESALYHIKKEATKV